MTPARATEIRAKAEALLQDAPAVAPIDVELLAAQNGIRVRRENLDPMLSGFTFIATDGPIVTLNNARNLGRQRFTLAHEIGHVTLHRSWLETVIHVAAEFRITTRGGVPISLVETLHEEANHFALELLLPQNLIDSLGLRGWDIDERAHFASHAALFGVNVATLQHRLLTLT